MIKELLERFPELKFVEEQIINAKDAMIASYEAGGKLLLCGNGGSCADCEHIVGELMKGFLKMRPLSDEKKAELKKKCAEIDDGMLRKLQGGLPAISLTSFSALNTAFCNDVDPDLVYAQALMGLAKKDDILIAISTSGNSKNVVNAAMLAKAIGIKVIALTGESGGKLLDLADVCICAPEKETFKVQELHLPIYHYLCAEIEEYFFRQ